MPGTEQRIFYTQYMLMSIYLYISIRVLSLIDLFTVYNADNFKMLLDPAMIEKNHIDCMELGLSY